MFFKSHKVNIFGWFGAQFGGFLVMQLQIFKNRKINLKEDINLSIAYTKESKAKKINNSARIRFP